MTGAQRPLAWLPFSIAEASLTGKPCCDDMYLAQAWSYLQDRLDMGQVIQHDYDLADYGLTSEDVRERFAEYLATYDASA